MPDPKRERQRDRATIRRLQQEVDDLRHILGDIDPAYASAYRDLCDLAIHGCRRPDDLGGPITTNHAESRPPNHHPKAYHHRNEERRLQRANAARLRAIVDELVDPTPVRIEVRASVVRFDHPQTA